MSDDAFSERMRRLGDLVEEVERSCPRATLEQVRALVRAVLDVHGEGLKELLEAARDPAAGGSERLVNAIAGRSSVASLLLFHDLHPEPIEARVRRAVASANERANVEARAEIRHVDGAEAVVDVSGGTAAARELLERVVRGVADEMAPDVTVVVEGVGPKARSDLIPAERLVARAGGGA